MGKDFAPEKGKTLFIFGQDKDSILQYVDAFGRIPAGFTVYTSVQDADGLDSPADHGGGVHHAQFFAERFPDSVIQIGLWMVGVLDGIIAQRYDGNIDRIGEWVRKAERPVYLRIGYEFDFPQNGYDPEKYIAAYRHIADRLRQNGIDNIAYVWHSYAGRQNIPIKDWYPGDAYVDWCAVSYFTNPEEFMEDMVRFAHDRRKPLMIAEASPCSLDVRMGRKTWDGWFAKVFRFIEKHDVRAFCYIGCDWDAVPMFASQGWGDARVQADPTVRKLWSDKTNGSRFIFSSKELFASLGYRKRR